ncbi:unnamed protein product, partial [Ectocarpus fasciculatus]
NAKEGTRGLIPSILSTTQIVEKINTTCLQKHQTQLLAISPHSRVVSPIHHSRFTPNTMRIVGSKPPRASERGNLHCRAPHPPHT